MSGKSIFDFCGWTVGNTYKITEALGHGGFGAVYRALNIADDKEYALKCVAKGEPGSKERISFSREWAMNKYVAGHRGIVRAHHAIPHGRFVFIVFDLCTGGDLFSHVAEKRTYFRNDDLVKIAFVSLLDAVQHCHDRGVFHYDIKLENVLCSEDGSALYLADFGLSTKREHTKVYGVGSHDYQPPEALGQQVELDTFSVRHIDIWGLGMVLLNMITGRNPWGRASTDDPAFHSFCQNPMLYLRTYLPISVQACAMFAQVFEMCPWSRLTLDELRAEVLEMETFFMTDDELEIASPYVRAQMERYLNGSPAPSVAPSLVEQDEGESVTADILADEIYAVPTIEEDRRRKAFELQREDETSRPAASPQPAAAQSSTTVDSSSTASSSSTSSSSLSTSSGSILITPDTHPVRDVNIACVTRSVSNLVMTPLADSSTRPKNPVRLIDLEAPSATHYQPSRKTMLRNAARQMGMA